MTIKLEQRVKDLEATVEILTAMITSFQAENELRLSEINSKTASDLSYGFKSIRDAEQEVLYAREFKRSIEEKHRGPQPKHMTEW